MTNSNYKEALKHLRIMNQAVKEAQAESRRLGVPNVYSRNGQLYYEMPDGSITTKRPF